MRVVHVFVATTLLTCLLCSCSNAESVTNEANNKESQTSSIEIDSIAQAEDLGDQSGDTNESDSDKGFLNKLVTGEPQVVASMLSDLSEINPVEGSFIYTNDEKAWHDYFDTLDSTKSAANALDYVLNTNESFFEMYSLNLDAGETSLEDVKGGANPESLSYARDMVKDSMNAELLAEEVAQVASFDRCIVFNRIVEGATASGNDMTQYSFIGESNGCYIQAYVQDTFDQWATPIWDLSIMINSTDEQASYKGMFKKWLERFDPSEYDDVYTYGLE